MTVTTRLLMARGAPVDYRIAWLIALTLNLCVAAPLHSAAQQTITVRFVDSKSGKPIKNFYVGVTAWSGDWRGCALPKDAAFSIEQYEESREGSATIRLPERHSAGGLTMYSESTKVNKHGALLIHLLVLIPEHLKVDSPGELHGTAVFSVEDALKSGVVVAFSKTTPAPQSFLRPGEVVVLTRRITKWDRIRQEIP